MRKGLVISLFALLYVGALAGVAMGDVVIHMKNGTTIRVPANNNDIASIDFDGGGPANSNSEAAAKKKAPPQPEQAPRTRTRSSSYKQEKVTPRELAGSGPKKPVVGLPPASEFRTSAVIGEGDAVNQGSSGRVIRVGRGRDYERPSEVARQIKPGDILEIEPGLYLDDFVHWKVDNITLRGIMKDGKRPHMRATVPPVNGKAIWIINGKNVVVENIEFSGTRVRDRNGAGIRFQSGTLTVRNSYFHHNEGGILTTSHEDMELTIEDSEFSYRVFANVYAHAIYVGKIKKLTVTNSYFHHNDNGHQIKTRAAENHIYYNYIADKSDGSSSYLIDFSNCGKSYVIGNILHQGRYTENSNMIAYGPEGCGGRPKGLYLAHNTMVNERGSGVFVMNRSMTPAVMINNLLVGKGKISRGPITEKNNLIVLNERFANRKNYDFHLARGAKAIGGAIEPGRAGGRSMVPRSEFSFPAKLKKRVAKAKPEIGAYEYGG